MKTDIAPPKESKRNKGKILLFPAEKELNTTFRLGETRDGCEADKESACLWDSLLGDRRTRTNTRISVIIH